MGKAALCSHEQPPQRISDEPLALPAARGRSAAQLGEGLGGATGPAA